MKDVSYERKIGSLHFENEAKIYLGKNIKNIPRGLEPEKSSQNKNNKLSEHIFKEHYTVEEIAGRDWTDRLSKIEDEWV